MPTYIDFDEPEAWTLSSAVSAVCWVRSPSWVVQSRTADLGVLYNRHECGANERCCEDWPRKVHFHPRVVHKSKNFRYAQMYQSKVQQNTQIKQTTYAHTLLFVLDLHLARK